MLFPVDTSGFGFGVRNVKEAGAPSVLTVEAEFNWDVCPFPATEDDVGALGNPGSSLGRLVGEIPPSPDSGTGTGLPGRTLDGELSGRLPLLVAAVADANAAFPPTRRSPLDKLAAAACSFACLCRMASKAGELLSFGDHPPLLHTTDGRIIRY